MLPKAILWDLDGTLLNTLDDLAASTNAALAMHGMPTRTLSEVRAFVGNGVRKLIERAVPEGTGEEAAEHVLADFIAHYGAHSRDNTAPYPGVMDMLRALHARGVRMAVVSNKVDFATKELSALYFGELMGAAVGDDPSREKKPAPDSPRLAMRLLSVAPEDCVYIGDSDVDVQTAANAGTACIAVSWGFRDRACLIAAGAPRIADTPEELLAMLTEEE